MKILFTSLTALTIANVSYGQNSVDYDSLVSPLHLGGASLAQEKNSFSHITLMQSQAKVTTKDKGSNSDFDLEYDLDQDVVQIGHIHQITEDLILGLSVASLQRNIDYSTSLSSTLSAEIKSESPQQVIALQSSYKVSEYVSLGVDISYDKRETKTKTQLLSSGQLSESDDKSKKQGGTYRPHIRYESGSYLVMARFTVENENLEQQQGIKAHSRVKLTDSLALGISAEYEFELEVDDVEFEVDRDFRVGLESLVTHSLKLSFYAGQYSVGSDTVAIPLSLAGDYLFDNGYRLSSTLEHTKADEDIITSATDGAKAEHKINTMALSLNIPI